MKATALKIISSLVLGLFLSCLSMDVLESRTSTTQVASSHHCCLSTTELPQHESQPEQGLCVLQELCFKHDLDTAKQFEPLMLEYPSKLTNSVKQITLESSLIVMANERSISSSQAFYIRCYPSHAPPASIS